MPRAPRRIRYTLRDRELLSKIMEHPGCGTPYTVRTLATATACSRSIIGHLLSGEQDSVPMETAHAVAEALGVAVLVLFTPPMSPFSDTLSGTRDAS
jgi:hypothetical protein